VVVRGFSVVLYAKMAKNDNMQGFCSWFSVTDVRLAVKHSLCIAKSGHKCKESK